MATVNLVLSETELEALIIALEQYLDWVKEKGTDWSNLNNVGRMAVRSVLIYSENKERDLHREGVKNAR